MEKETIEMPMKRENGEKETVVHCIFTLVCVFFAISTASYSTFTSWYLIQQMQSTLMFVLPQLALFAKPTRVLSQRM